jgi:3-methyl-2-oxobutanoate hydroxymethyltransferase
LARITAPELLKKKASGEKIAMVTAYDAAQARLVDAGGADMVLVGDSLGMVVQGQPDTLGVTLRDMAYHGRCVAAGLTRAHLSVDLPFMSYQISVAQAMRSAGRLVREGKAQSVKLEGGVRSAPAIRAIVEAGIPVVGHIGLTPQSVHAMGGFKVQGPRGRGRRSHPRGRPGGPGRRRLLRRARDGARGARRPHHRHPRHPDDRHRRRRRM